MAEATFLWQNATKASKNTRLHFQGIRSSNNITPLQTRFPRFLQSTNASNFLAVSINRGPGSSVGIATNYGLDCLG